MNGEFTQLFNGLSRVFFTYVRREFAAVGCLESAVPANQIPYSVVISNHIYLKDVTVISSVLTAHPVQVPAAGRKKTKIHPGK